MTAFHSTRALCAAAALSLSMLAAPALAAGTGAPLAGTLAGIGAGAPVAVSAEREAITRKFRPFDGYGLSVPLTELPRTALTDRQLRQLSRMGVETGADLVEARPVPLARVLDMDVDSVLWLQVHLRNIMR